MASPKIEVFFVYDETTGAPLTGQTPTFSTYKDDLGTNVSQPTISEIGGGAYKFTPVFSDPDRGIVYIIDTGAGGTPDKVARYMRPEDWNVDNADVLSSDIKNFQEGKWQVHVTGPDANRLVIYAPDDVTPLKKYDLFDEDGAPTPVNPFRRDPV